MAFAYRVRDEGAVYFVTFTVHQWVDVFSRPCYRQILLDSLRYCQQHKGLDIFAWVLMSNHIHLIIRSRHESLIATIRDLKKFTAKKIVHAIESNQHESRKAWLLMTLRYCEKIWFWEEGYHGEEIYTPEFFETKLNYIHQNPVRNGLVEKPEDYLLSSAGDYLGVRKGALDLVMMSI